MQWLTRLLAATAEQTGGLPAVVLDPFKGSGTGGVAAVKCGVRYIGIEMDPVSVRECGPSIRATGPVIEAPLRLACSLAGAEPCPGDIEDPEDACSNDVDACTAIIPDEPHSYYVACSRIMAAIGSPEAAAQANTLAPVGAQLGLL